MYSNIMGRRPVFSDSAILQATRVLAAREGPADVTMQEVAVRLGAPIGSLYHRFPSRSALLARAWLETVALFQEGFLRQLQEPGARIGEIAAYTLRFCRQR